MGAVFSACEECPLAQVYTWVAFAGFMLASWDFVSPAVMNRLIDETDANAANGEPVKRTYMLALCLYMLVLLWYHMLYLMVFAYMGCSLVAMTAHYIPNELKLFKGLLVWLADPNILFRSVRTIHMPLHGLVMGSWLVACLVSVLWYVQKRDLENKVRARSKFVRIVFSTAATMVTTYLIYCVVAFMRALVEQARKAG